MARYAYVFVILSFVLLIAQPLVFGTTSVEMQQAVPESQANPAQDEDYFFGISTYFGGGYIADSDFTEITGTVSDAEGNIYLTGYTTADNLPVVNAYQASHRGGQYEAFLAMFDKYGVLQYCTYLGGGGDDQAQAIALDSEGNIYVAGSTSSGNFPLQNQYQGRLGGDDCFVTKFTPTGDALVYSTYLGTGGDDVAMGIDVDDSGRALVGGYTSSGSFPHTAGAYQTSYGGGDNDGFVVLLNETGNGLRFGSYLGGSLDDRINDVSAFQTGDFGVTGETESSDLPCFNALNSTYGGLHDGFAASFDIDGDAKWSTYLGGGLNDYGYAITVDAEGSFYLTGSTSSWDFPIENAYDPTPPPEISGTSGRHQCFVTKISGDGQDIIYSTYYGGHTGFEFGLAITIDGSGNAYVAGWTQSYDLPVQNGLQGSYAGYQDSFVIRLNSTGNGLDFATYFGSDSFEEARGIALGEEDSIFFAGSTWSSHYPVQYADESQLQGFGSGFLTEFAVDTTAPTINGPDDVHLTYPHSNNYITWTYRDRHPKNLTILKNGSIELQQNWARLSNSRAVLLDGLLPNTYNYTFVAVDLQGNTAMDTVMVFVTASTTSESTSSTSTTSTADGGGGGGFAIPQDLLVYGGVCIAVVAIIVVVAARRR